MNFDICIIGGGASGMAAAVEAADREPGCAIVLLEKKNEPGRKLLATGNGRCNLTNESCPGALETKKFFARLGVLTRTEEEGRVYPRSGDAADVRDALAEAVRIRGVECRTDAAVTDVTPLSGGGFMIHYRCGGAEETVRADLVLLAAGGKAGPAFGTTGDGAVFARKLGLSVTRLAPALTGVETREDVSAVSGVRQEAVVTLNCGAERTALFSERGEVQFTDYGISGICVFNMTREMTIPEGRSLKDGLSGYEIAMDFIPEIRGAEALLRERAGAIEKAGLDPFENGRLLRSIVRAPLADEVLRRAARAAGAGGRGAVLCAAAEELRNFTVHPVRLRGWQYAQVTKGGVRLSEVDPETMEAVLVPGLYLSGEILDHEGPCGGYNLQFAWETGLRAGRAMAGRLAEKNSEEGKEHEHAL